MPASFELLDVDLVIARLKAQLPALRGVHGAAGLSEAMEAFKGEPPQAYVVPISDMGSESRANATVQRVAAGFGVVLFVRNLRDPQGEAALAKLRPVRIALLGALLGHQLAPGYEPIQKDRGRLLQVRDAYLVWQDDFRTATHISDV